MGGPGGASRPPNIFKFVRKLVRSRGGSSVPPVPYGRQSFLDISTEGRKSSLLNIVEYF